MLSPVQLHSLRTRELYHTWVGVEKSVVVGALFRARSVAEWREGRIATAREYRARYYPDTTASFVPSGSVLRHSILGSVCMDANGAKDLMVPDTYSLARRGGVQRDRRGERGRGHVKGINRRSFHPRRCQLYGWTRGKCDGKGNIYIIVNYA